VTLAGGDEDGAWRDESILDVGDGDREPQDLGGNSSKPNAIRLNTVDYILSNFHNLEVVFVNITDTR
jgi:hypothetical protein